MQLPGTGSIWFNGNLVPWADAKVHVGTHALHYGGSIIEGLRAYATPRGPAIVGLREHVKRLFDSARMLELAIPFQAADIERAIVELVRENEFDTCYIRPLVFRGYAVLGVDPTNVPTDVAIAAWPHGAHFGAEAREQGIDMCVSSWRRMAPDTLPALSKSAANYLNSQLAFLEAKKNGFHDALVLDWAGHVSEGTGANVFLVVDGELWTPPIAASILAGVTRRFVLVLAHDRGLRVREELVPRELLYAAEEVFLTGTAAEITPVRSIDRRAVGSGARGPLTAALQREYLAIVRGEAPDRHGWMTWVGV